MPVLFWRSHRKFERSQEESGSPSAPVFEAALGPSPEAFLAGAERVHAGRSRSLRMKGLQKKRPICQHKFRIIHFFNIRAC